jgi:hypothetical protein
MDLRSIGHVEQQECGGGGNPKFGCKMKDHQSGLRFHRRRHVFNARGDGCAECLCNLAAERERKPWTLHPAAVNA